MFLRILRVVVLVVCATGIAGMIVGTLATDNNNGVVMTFGLVTAMAVVVLMATSAAVRSQEAGRRAVDDALAEDVERRVAALVERGADEQQVRLLVRDAVRLGRGGRA